MEGGDRARAEGTAAPPGVESARARWERRRGERAGAGGGGAEGRRSGWNKMPCDQAADHLGCDPFLIFNAWRSNRAEKMMNQPSPVGSAGPNWARHVKFGPAQSRHGRRVMGPTWHGTSQRAMLGPPLQPVGRHGPAREAGDPLRHDGRHDPLVAWPIKDTGHLT
jgi:hypothetical protein